MKVRTTRYTFGIETKRTYDDPCGAARALDLIGERWALLVVRELLLGPKRFTDLRADLPHVSPNVLTERLGELERAGVVQRRKLPPPAASQVYELTDWGSELEPLMVELGRWGARSPLLDPEGHLSTDSQMLALRTLFDAEASDELSATYEWRLGEIPFSVRVDGGQIQVRRGDAPGADAVIELEPDNFHPLLLGEVSLDEATSSGQVKVSGDADAVERLLAAVRPPELVPLPAG